MTSVASKISHRSRKNLSLRYIYFRVVAIFKLRARVVYAVYWSSENISKKESCVLQKNQTLEKSYERLSLSDKSAFGKYFGKKFRRSKKIKI